VPAEEARITFFSSRVIVPACLAAFISVAISFPSRDWRILFTSFWQVFYLSDGGEHLSLTPKKTAVQHSE
jgi:hypothetical protein